METQTFNHNTHERVGGHANSEHLYTVSGNMDQIVRNGLDTDYTWEPHPRQPNSVSTKLVFEQAVELHNKMRSLNMVAFKNWS